MHYVCPMCKGELSGAYRCELCRLDFPVICGIPDFRLHPDPYIGIEADRAKGAALACAIEGMTFEQAVRHYYAITPDDPSDLAEIWTARALAEVDIARSLLKHAPDKRPLLDVGCSTGAALIAANGGVGVDVAFRWLIIGALRLKEAGVDATLVCANAEHLPFPDNCFALATCFDTLEHTNDAQATLRELRRTSALLVMTSNNRWAPMPEPHVHLWGVQWLPRPMQKAFVARRRKDLHSYTIQIRSASEGRRLAIAAGWRDVRVEAAPVYAPHKDGSRLIALYNSARGLPGTRLIAPRWMLSGC